MVITFMHEEIISWIMEQRKNFILLWDRLHIVPTF